MYTEKEDVKRIRQALKAGQTKEQISSRLMSKGYKLEYINLLLKKAKRRSKLIFTTLIILIILVLIGANIYSFFFRPNTNIVINITNPLAGYNVQFSEEERGTDQNEQGDLLQTVNLEDIEITKDFVTYLLSELKIHEYLHKIPLTDNLPIVNFKTPDKNFYSIIDNGIETYEGLSTDADIEFSLPKQTIVNATISNSPEEVFRNDLSNGLVQISLEANEVELAAKGYLGFYNSLQN
jgi:hypothetical protein